MDCRICGLGGMHASYRVREMMFGSKEIFEYFSVHRLRMFADCGDPARHDAALSNRLLFDVGLRRRGRNLTPPQVEQRAGRCVAIAVVQSRFRSQGANLCVAAPQRSQSTSRILDIGCGRGLLLNELAQDGFHQLTGLDPFVDRDLVYNNGVHIHRAPLDGLHGQFDLVMMHHSMEHMDDQHRVLDLASRLLAPNGCMLVRIPVLGYSWRAYGVDWGQLDAPRHFYLHSFRSFERLVEQSALRLDDSYYDSTSLQFWLSEQYTRDIPLNAPNSHGVDPEHSPFSAGQLKAWHRQAVRLNALRDGDSACFFLRHKSFPHRVSA